MEYYKLLLRELREDDVFHNEADQIRGKLDCKAKPTNAFVQMLSQITRAHEGVAEIYSCNRPDARVLVRFDDEARNHHAILQEVIQEVNSKIHVKGVEEHPDIDRWLHDSDDMSQAISSEVRPYASYRQEA